MPFLAVTNGINSYLCFTGQIGLGGPFGVIDAAVAVAFALLTIPSFKAAKRAHQLLQEP